MIKTYLKRFLTIVSLIVLPLSICVFTQNYADNDSQRLMGFYQEKENSLDVVYIGASDVYNAFSPALAYKEYGYTSYPYAFGSANLFLFKSQINEILNYQSPSIIVVDLNAAISLERSFYDTIYDSDSNEFDIVLRRFTDNTPFSENKFNTISQFGFNDDKLSYYFPFIMHHGSINCINSTKEKISQINRGFTYLKGINSSNHQLDNASLYDIKDNYEQQAIFKEDENEFRHFLEYCQSLNCKILFTKIPHRIVNEAKYNRFLKGNYLCDIVKEYGFDYLNFDHNFEEIGLNVNDDFADDGHLNADGQRKFTFYFSKLLTEKYLSNQTIQNTENIDRWNRSSQYIEEFYNYYDELTEEVSLNETSSLIEILSKRLEK